MSVTITRDEWLKALEDVGGPLPDPNALTLAEFAQMLGLKRTAARARLNLLIDAGKAEATTKMISINGAGARPVPAYRLLKEPPKKGKR